ncbi:hypothetical protein O7626_39480 [Micromonospora sp. WMMD1102]|uniref:hypothetical protein n=1 Tax=Micromonospora sp. WMMD1102 TaxID=3016105 RepID=UPI002414DFCE|nr:hypothetical protein [Micromonospora sp. WMMD1102]MDG4791898.1 hypothetical protein [Micromonospora sp. WMMD1102]
MIQVDGGGHGQIVVGGRDMSKLVRGFMLTSEVGKAPLLVLSTTIRERVSAGVDVHAVLDTETTAALVALGWTPPETATGGASDG